MAKVRKKSRRRKTRFRGNPTEMKTKKGGDFVTKSSYETRYAEMLEADPKVKRFVYEPFKIPYKVRGKKKNYIPDFLVEYVDGREELVEIKPAALVDLPRNKAKIKAGNNHETPFVVITEKELGI